MMGRLPLWFSMVHESFAMRLGSSASLPAGYVIQRGR